MPNPVQNPEPQTKAQQLSRVAAGLGLLAVAIWMLATFLPALAWATVLTIATWPLFVAVRQRSGRTQAAAAITALVAVTVLAPLVVAISEGVHEIREIIRWYIEVRKEGFEAPEWIASLPAIGSSVADWLDAHLQYDLGPFSGADVQSATAWGRIIR